MKHSGTAGNGKGNLINQIRAKVGKFAGFYFFAPLIQLTIIRFPKFPAKLGISQNRGPLTFFK
jgi:hypothetical protein